ncbi:hypothetical protein IWX83_000242 [Flavobacterium sp. CG_9.1]|uniref:hypothetical protein n=1 Tax=Flavobacterium sp. CG_9.1 TaxID=2787728 RepID=UPI0018C9147C|nr:hypothetical protein [Flavobacterium sp. CG_9.1]MBG6060479.1 hypothetical protein [Flavobacterium sp. CG_9.1]
MKKTTRKILLIILLSTFFALTACNHDVLNENIQNIDAGIKSKKITFDQFKKQKKAFSIVSDINKKQNELKLLSNKTTNNTVSNFTIDTQKGLHLEYANLHSFTFPIHREVDNGKVENLVLSFQNDGSYKVKILKYNLTQQEKIDIANDQLKNIQNPIITIPIENFNLNAKISSCETVTETIWVSCSHGIHNSSNINTWAQCEAATPPRVYTVSKIKCITADGSTGGSPPIDDGFGDNYGTGGGSYPVNYPTPETNPYEYENGISTPILTTQNNYDIRNTQLFNQSLTPQQTQWSSENLNAYNFILNLVRNKNWTDESKGFGKDLIDLIISSNLNIFTSYSNLSYEFNNLSDFEHFINYEEDLNIVSVAIPFQVDKKITNRNIKIAPLLDLRLQIVITPSPNFSLDETNSTTFLESTLLPGNSWTQTAYIVTKSSSNDAGTTAEITITGYINIGVKVADYEIGVKRLKEIIISIDKNTGNINYTKVKNLN